MRHLISPAKPLFILEQGDSIPIQKLWHMMPEEFRPYCAVLLRAPQSKDVTSWEPIWHNIRAAQDAGVPAFLSVQGGISAGQQRLHSGGRAGQIVPGVSKLHRITLLRTQLPCQYFDKLFPIQSLGEAMVMRMNNRWFVTNTNENKNIPESFSFSLGINGSGVTLSGYLEPNSVLIVCQEDGGLFLHANNYIVNTHIWDEPRPEKFDIEAYLRGYVTDPDDSEWRLTTLCIKGMADMSSSVKYYADNGEVQWTWNAEKRMLDIQLRHNGPVDLNFPCHS